MLCCKSLRAGIPETGSRHRNFDLLAIDKWCDARHPHLFSGISEMNALEASRVARERIEAMRRNA